MEFAYKAPIPQFSAALFVHFESCMVRRTKEDAAETRSSLLDAAERIFYEKGVSRTSLNDIAVGAGTTRGAIYWHFKDKADLFNAMMERVTLPMEATLSGIGVQGSADPLDKIRVAMRSALHLTMHNIQVRRVFEVATHKVEYVDELLAVKQRHLEVRNRCVAQLQDDLEQAVRHHSVALPIPLEVASQCLHAMVGGLIENWLLDPEAFDLVAMGDAALGTYLAGLGFPVCSAPAAARAAQ